MVILRVWDLLYISRQDVYFGFGLPSFLVHRCLNTYTFSHLTVLLPLK